MAKKNQWRNSFWGLISAITDILCGLYISRLLLNTFGAPAHGLINSINNFLGLFLAIEFAFSPSRKKIYYNVLEQSNQSYLSAVYRRNRRALGNTITLATITVAIISLIYPLFYIKLFTYWDTALLVFALGLYILVKTSSKIQTDLITANYNIYITKILATFTTLLTALLCYFFVKWGYSLSIIKVMVALILLIHPVFYLLYIRIHFHLPKTTKKLPPLPHKPIFIWKRIINIFLSRTDILILTIAATLTDVSIYAVYAMVGRYMARCINALFDGREAIYGRAFANGDRAAAKKAYAHTQFYLANFLAIIFGVGIIMLNPFVQLYTKFVKGINYGQFWFGFFLLISQMLACIRNAQNKFVYAPKNVNHKRLLIDAIIEAVINVVVSVVLIFPLGIMGVVIGTVVAYTYSVIRLWNYRRKYIIKTSPWHSIRRYLPVIIIIIIATYTAVNNPPHPTNKLTWITDAAIVGVLIFLLNLVLNLIINPMFNERLIKRLYKKILHLFKQKIKRQLKLFKRKIKQCFIFIYKAIATSWQRGFIRATRTYFRHKKSIHFENTHQNMDDIPYLTALGKILVNQKMDLSNPQTLNEKINWLKIYHYRDIYTTMSDKAAVKDYVAQTLGANYIIPTYGVWDNFDDIDWESLPQTFVLKCTHDSGSVYFVRDKDQTNLDTVRKYFKQFLTVPYWRRKRENAYHDVPPRIIAERYLPSLNHHDSIEYKFTCFNGKVVFGTICQGYPHGSTKHRTNDFYTADFQHLPWRAWYHNARHPFEKPAQWDEMVAISEKFAKDIPYLRVDLYVEDGQIYFGEFTFYTGGGFIEFYPRKMDLILGQQLTLPEPMTPHQYIQPVPAVQPAAKQTPTKKSKAKTATPSQINSAPKRLDDSDAIDYDGDDDE